MAFDASICWRVSVFLSKCSTLFQSNALDFLLLFSAFVKLKTAINQKFRNTNHPIRNPASVLFQTGRELENSDIIICRNVIVKFFWHQSIYLLIFRQWFKFHVNTIAGSGVMTTFMYKICGHKFGNWKDLQLNLV